MAHERLLGCSFIGITRLGYGRVVSCMWLAVLTPARSAPWRRCTTTDLHAPQSLQDAPYRRHDLIAWAALAFPRAAATAVRSTSSVLLPLQKSG
jgi:hypothetical protein